MDYICRYRDTIFYVYKNTNKHIVVYEWIDDKIAMHWYDSEKRDLKRVKLTLPERKLAYGVKLSKDKKTLRINCAPKKEMWIEGKRISTELHGERCFIDRVYTHIEGKTRMGFPRVSYIIIYGESVLTGGKVQERIEASNRD